jgi:peptidoglycan/LPS O-acetylase OafA/YrhL
MTNLALKSAAIAQHGRVQAPTRYYPQLDGLRAMAVLLVLLSHMESPVLPGFLQRLFAVGWIGVDAFFVLSGFLITKILLNCKPSVSGFGLFVFRRILRTWPLYFVLLGLAFLAFRHTSSGARISWVRHIFFLQNYTPLVARTLGATWSLCVEEQFYFTWPFLVFLLPRRALLPGLAVLFACLPLLRFWGWHHGLTWQLYLETQFHLDGLLAGSCVALLLPRRTGWTLASKWIAIVLLVLGVFISIVGFWHDGSSYGVMHNGHNVVFGFTSLAVTFAALVWLLLHEDLPILVRLFSLSPVRYIGRISYGIYLLHYGLIEMLDKVPLHNILGAWTDSQMFLIPLRIGFVIAVAGISYRFFESPILRWKERFK